MKPQPKVPEVQKEQSSKQQLKVVNLALKRKDQERARLMLLGIRLQLENSGSK